MKIYTKTGDAGKTKLISGKSISKGDLRLETYGNVDELNSFLGWAHVQLMAVKQADADFLRARLIKIQHQLFNLGSVLATDDPKQWSQLPQLQTQNVQDLETDIDAMSAKMPELKNFILPGGTSAAAVLHVARTVCRRAERATVRLSETEEVPPLAVVFLNRLSDFLFVAARAANQMQNCVDPVWQPEGKT